MATIQTLVQLDEFMFEHEEVDVGSTPESLQALENVVLVQDNACELYVTLTGNTLTLWSPQVHWADQERRNIERQLPDLLGHAGAWLAAHTGQGIDEIMVVLDVEKFGPLK